MQNSIVAAYRKLDIKPMKIMEGILTPTPLPEARGVKSEELGVRN
jgi:hypothetical protein